MTSKAAKRRTKKAITLAGGLSVPQRATGKDRRHLHQREEDPRMTVARARLRHQPATKAQLHAAMTDRSFSDEASRCIKLKAINAEQAARMQGVVDDYRAARRAYRLAIGVSDSPQNAAIGFLTEGLLAPADPVEDIPATDSRTPEQRERDATRRWMQWQGLIGLIGSHDRQLISRAILGELSLLDDDGWTNAQGQAFVHALRHWVDLIEAYRA